MFCPECGKSIPDNSVFCEECGAKIVKASPPPIQQPVYQAPPPTNYQPVYKKKKPVGLLIFIAILLIIIGGLVYVIGSFMWFPPKDLGVKYTQSDFNSAMRKTGVHIRADLGDGKVYDNKSILEGSNPQNSANTITDSARIKNLSLRDYTWKFSNYKHKAFKLSSVEATAFFNEMAPPVWWFSQSQIKINPDGTIASSSKADVKRIKEELFSDVAGQIPVPLPDIKLNLYTEGSFSIKNNKITMNPKTIEAGPISLPNEYKSGSNLKAFSGYLERFYSVIPKLQINSFGVKDGQFLFDGNIPTEVSITPKNAH